ncbi:DUF3006 domain-containing protein [Neobacillus mesonae]|uniref:DUF3006 domain-containing protein n=1 Tax=Neobacillus mesonae TaxID=1193713 RepID=UPI00203F496A|nr:DUF3006 domain-containing protein [Neobacillus mesonae]MCM3570622.1 DUF3006 domain-containing protein [Neobacillus mesonae]
MKGIIDRFEGKYAVVEINGVTKDFPKSIFPKAASVGDVVEINGDKVSVLEDETKKRRQEVEKLMNEVWDD